MYRSSVSWASRLAARGFAARQGGALGRDLRSALRDRVQSRPSEYGRARFRSKGALWRAVLVKDVRCARRVDCLDLARRHGMANPAATDRAQGISVWESGRRNLDPLVGGRGGRTDGRAGARSAPGRPLVAQRAWCWRRPPYRNRREPRSSSAISCRWTSMRRIANVRVGVLRCVAG